MADKSVSSIYRTYHDNEPAENQWCQIEDEPRVTRSGRDSLDRSIDWMESLEQIHGLLKKKTNMYTYVATIMSF